MLAIRVIGAWFCWAGWVAGSPWATLADRAARLARARISHGAQQTVHELLTRELHDGEAVIWYLGHAGWAVRTKTHFLVFDYWRMQREADSASLSRGLISPEELSDQQVMVFVTHAHGDHYDPVIFEWQNHLPDITYVLGWRLRGAEDHVSMAEEREVKHIGNVEISTVDHSFDGIPEVAYLVQLDGLTIYHSGDHASVGDTLNRTFQDNVDYLANLTDGLDIALLSIFGSRGGDPVNLGDRYTLDRLQPAVTFPMHRGRDPEAYGVWSSTLTASGAPTTVHYALTPGDWFVYRGREIKEHGAGRR